MSLDRRSFLKKMLGFGVGVPTVAALTVLGDGEQADQSSTSGNIIVKSGAKHVVINGNHLRGGDIIIEPDAEDVMITNTLLTKEEETTT